MVWILKSVRKTKLPFKGEAESKQKAGRNDISRARMSVRCRETTIVNSKQTYYEIYISNIKKPINKLFILKFSKTMF